LYWYTRIIVITIIVTLFATIFMQGIYNYIPENKPQVCIALQIFCSYNLLYTYCYLLYMYCCLLYMYFYLLYMYCYLLYMYC